MGRFNQDNTVWTFLDNIWKTGQTREEEIKKYYDYWDGKIAGINPFPKQEKSATNIIQPIVETKLKSMLDAQFTLAVVPQIKTFSNLKSLKNAQAVADVYNEELKNILKDNNIQKLQEKVGRDGFVSGFGVLQTLWETKDDIKGKIKISYINPKSLRWDKNCTSLKDTSFIGYTLSLNPILVKERYCRTQDGGFDEEKCKKIDQLAVSLDPKDAKQADKMTNKVFNYINSISGGQGYVNQNDVNLDGIKSNKIVYLRILFLLDESYYAPEKNDSPKEQQEKDSMLRQYPNGRMIIFSTEKKHQIIFEDVPLDESFKNLGNIDIFNIMNTNTLYGRSEIEDLFTIQDRINGLYAKFRRSIQNAYSTLLIDKTSIENISEINLPKFAVTFLKNLNLSQPYTVSNNGMQDALQILEMLDGFKKYSYEIGRVNETMLYGTRQTGTTSASQIETLQESPMTDIRQIQRNFKDFMINIGEKCLTLIQEKYNFDRLIHLNVDIEGAKYAHIRYQDPSMMMSGMSPTEDSQPTPTNPQEQQPEKDTSEIWIDLLNEAGEAIQSIKMDKNWEFKVDVIAGTEIPRSRKESAQLIIGLVEKGLLGDVTDIDLLEEILRSNDVPNYRTIISIMKNKQKELQKQKEQAPPPSMKDVISNPEIARSFSDVFKSLGGFSLAKGELLQALGLNPATDTLDVAPVADVMSRTDTEETVLLAPSRISSDPKKQKEGIKKAVEITTLDAIK